MAENINMFGYVLVSFTMILKIYFDSDWHNLTCIISTVDGNKYCVREKKIWIKSLIFQLTQRLKFNMLVKSIQIEIILRD